MALPKKRVEKTVSDATTSAKRTRPVPKPPKPTSANGTNGDRPFKEEDADEVYQGMYRFFHDQVHLSEDEAARRALRSTETWRRDVFGENGR